MSEALPKAAQGVLSALQQFEASRSLHGMIWQRKHITELRAALSQAGQGGQGEVVAWRDLTEGEEIQAGDRLLSGGKEWAVLDPGSHVIGKTFSWANTYPVQRAAQTAPVPAEQREPIAEDDLTAFEKFIVDKSQNAPFFPADSSTLANATLHMIREVRATRALLSAAPKAPAVPDGYALVSVDALRSWGRLDEVTAACIYPVAAAPKPEHGEGK